MSPWSPLVYCSFRSFLVFDELGSLQGHWSCILQNAPPFGFVSCFSQGQTRDLGEYHRVDVAVISSYHIEDSQHVTSLAMLNFITYLWQCLPAFSTVKLQFFPFLTLFFGSQSLKSSSPGRAGLISTFQRAVYLYKLFGIPCEENLSLSYYFFAFLFIFIN